MDGRSIGVFDSGLGGLTTVKKLTELLPDEDIIYLGDTGRVPYGSRSRETIVKYSCQDAEFLAGFDVKAMVIACNTSSSTAYKALAENYQFPVFEVVETPARVAAASTKNGRIGVIGTAATIRSGAYESAIRAVAPDAIILSAACPLFVPLVENGRTRSGDIVAETVAREYLTPLLGGGVDTLILGCTHYPLLRGVISDVCGPDVLLIDSGAETAKLVAASLRECDMLKPGGAKGEIRYYVTDSIADFAALASRFMETKVFGNVEQITL